MSEQNNLQEVVEIAQKSWTGCDWATEFGPHKLNLCKLRSRQALLAAKAMRGEEAQCWRDAAKWLSGIESEAAETARLASQGLNSAVAGDVLSADQLFSQALAIASHFPIKSVYQKCHDVFIESLQREPHSP